MDALSPEPVKSERCVSGCGRKKPLRRKTNANEKTTEDFDSEGMLQEYPLFLFNDYVMHRWRVTSPRRKKSEWIFIIVYLFDIGTVERLPL